MMRHSEMVPEWHCRMMSLSSRRKRLQRRDLGIDLGEVFTSALDFLGDSANYAISIGVVGMGLAWRARAAFAKGVGLLALGLWVIGSTVWHAVAGTLPAAEVMGVVGILALLAKAGVVLMLLRFRTGDSNMRSVWICSRNDAIGNLAVIAAAAGVFGTGTGWPDIIVAAIMASLSISGGWQIVRQYRSEIRSLQAA